MSADVRQCPPKSASLLRFSNRQKNMPQAKVNVPAARKLGIGSLPVIPAGTMIPARGIPSVCHRVRVAHPRSASVRQCPPPSAGNAKSSLPQKCTRRAAPVAQTVGSEQAPQSPILTAVAPPPPLRYRSKIGKPIFGPADIGGHRRTLADIPPDLGAR